MMSGSLPSPVFNQNDSSTKLPSPFASNALSAIGHQTIKVSATDSVTHLQGYRSRFNIQSVKQNYQDKQPIGGSDVSKHHHAASGQQHHRNHHQRQSGNNRDTPTNDTTNQTFWCEPCERKFRTSDFLQRHIDEHEKCYFDGCKFEAHTLLVKKHIEMQHDSGLFQRIVRVETDEDIDKWRAERRKRYPTGANIELRQLAQEARMKRGERLTEKKGRFGKVDDRRGAADKSRRQSQQPKQRGQPKNMKNRRTQPQERVIIEAHTKPAPIENIVEVKETIASNVPAISVAPSQESEPDKKINALSALCMYSDSEDDDQGDIENDNQPLTEVEITVKTTEKASTEATTLAECHERTEPAMANESQCESNESEEKPAAIGESIPTPTVDSDDEPPDEQPIKHQSDFVCPPPKPTPQPNVSTEKSNSRRLPYRNSSRSEPPPKKPKRVTLLDMSKRWRKQNTLLEKLLETDIRHERNVLLQCVRYVVANDFFGIGSSEDSSATPSITPDT